MPNRDPIFFNHGSNPRVPSPAAKALAFALKTKEATRGVKKEHDNLFYINRSIVEPLHTAPRGSTQDHSSLQLGLQLGRRTAVRGERARHHSTRRQDPDLVRGAIRSARRVLRVETLSARRTGRARTIRLKHPSGRMSVSSDRH